MIYGVRLGDSLQHRAPPCEVRVIHRGLTLCQRWAGPLSLRFLTVEEVKE